MIQNPLKILVIYPYYGSLYLQHICADTLRSVAVLIAAGISSLFPDILPPADADSYGAIVVSVIIIFSLGPLLQGLVSTAMEIRDIIREGRTRNAGLLSC